MAIKLSDDVLLWGESHSFVLGVRRKAKKKKADDGAGENDNFKLTYYPTLKMALEVAIDKIAQSSSKVTSSNENDIQSLIKIIERIEKTLANVVPDIKLIDLANAPTIKGKKRKC